MVFCKLEDCKFDSNSRFLKERKKEINEMKKRRNDGTVVYLGSMFSRDGKSEMDAERHTATGNRANGGFTALMRRQNVNTAVCAVHNTVLVPSRR